MIRDESLVPCIVFRFVEKFDGGFVRKSFETTVAFDGKPLEVRIYNLEKTYYQTYSSIQVCLQRSGTPVSGFLYFTKSGKFVKYTAIDLLSDCAYTIPRVQLQKKTIEFFESCIAASFNNNQVKEATL